MLREALLQKNHSQVIVATEDLDYLARNSSMSQPGLQLLKSGQPMVRIVVSMRDIPDWIQSVFHQLRKPGLQYVKAGSYVTFAPQNLHAVTYFFGKEGFPVVTYPFMDVKALMCAVLTVPKTCTHVRNMMPL
jgi:hypothetical protein